MTFGRIEEGIHQEIELTDGSRAVSSVISESPEDDQCWSKHVVCIHRDVEEISDPTAPCSSQGWGAYNWLIEFGLFYFCRHCYKIQQPN
jgi:hypothetical protein